MMGSFPASGQGRRQRRPPPKHLMPFFQDEVKMEREQIMKGQNYSCECTIIIDTMNRVTWSNVPVDPVVCGCNLSKREFSISQGF